MYTANGLQLRIRLIAYTSQLHTLMLLQKKAIHNIAKTSYLDHTYPLFAKYRFFDIVELKTLIIIYRAKNNTLPINLHFFS